MLILLWYRKLLKKMRRNYFTRNLFTLKIYKSIKNSFLFQGDIMDLTKKEVEELQEQIIILYKVIDQNNTFKSFYYQDMDVEMPKSDSNLINELDELESADEILRKCIVELEEIKQNKKLEGKKFYEIIAKHDLRDLHEKYGIKEPKDLDKLDIKELLNLL